MKALKFSPALIVIIALVACAQLGLQKTQSFDEKLAYAYGVHTAILTSTTDALRTKSLSRADAVHVEALSDQSRQFLDSAKAIENTDPNGADHRLTLATAILTELQTYLQGK